jgi:nitroimidazol reductase NimA-like FMN-containing flavoprotein (pyridoxamine 5'-phosphate oxidase superfamily)
MPPFARTKSVPGGAPVAAPPSPEIEVLDRQECLRLLAETGFGRLAINLRADVPMIRPVNYVFDERTQSILFRTDFGSKFQGVIVSPRAAFEIDGADAGRQEGWSVIATGSVEKVNNQLELERFAQLEFVPWAPGDKPHWVRIRVSTVSGRRLSQPRGGSPA